MINYGMYRVINYDGAQGVMTTRALSLRVPEPIFEL